MMLSTPRRWRGIIIVVVVNRGWSKTSRTAAGDGWITPARESRNKRVEDDKPILF
jgi:hypothetical protein